MEGLIDFRLADWEHFRAPVNADGGEAWITHVWIEGSRILGSGVMADIPGNPPVEDVWLHPDRVPTRVLRRDNGWPRLSPEQIKAIHAKHAVEDAVAERAPIPAPEIPARPATLEEMPRGAKLIGKPAHEAGFQLRVTRARGPRLNQYWKVVETSDSIKVAGAHRDGRWFAAHWITKKGEWEFDFAYILVDGVLTPCNATELKVYIVNPN